MTEMLGFENQKKRTDGSFSACLKSVQSGILMKQRLFNEENFVHGRIFALQTNTDGVVQLLYCTVQPVWCFVLHTVVLHHKHGLRFRKNVAYVSYVHITFTGNVLLRRRTHINIYNNRPFLSKGVLARHTKHREQGFVITEAKHKSRKFENSSCFLLYNSVYNHCPNMLLTTDKFIELDNSLIRFENSQRFVINQCKSIMCIEKYIKITDVVTSSSCVP